MKIDMKNVFIGTIRKCTEYNTHTTFSSSTYIEDDCIGTDMIQLFQKKMQNY